MGSSGEDSYGGNVIRFFKPSTNEFVAYRLFSGSNYQYSSVVCAIAENTVAAADSGETKGYVYNLGTKTSEKNPVFWWSRIKSRKHELYTNVFLG